MFYTGRQIGPYKLSKILGRGGFGEVWLAERQAKFVTTKVAVKLPIEGQVDVDSIKEEAILWEQASGHPNVLPIIDADEYDGQIVIVSEYAPDGTIDDLLRKEGVLPIKRAVEMTVGILNGLEYLHNKNIIHRDIKPANILLQGNTPRLADFGMSRLMRGNSLSMNVNGTPYYMAPEAFNRKRNARTDIWSVGVILYRMLSGSLPFQSETLVDLVSEILVTQPAMLPAHIPERLQLIVTKALAKMPEARYESAREMREDLLDFQAIHSYEYIKTEQPPTQKDLKIPSPSTSNIGGASTNESLRLSFLSSSELEMGTLLDIPRNTADPIEIQTAQPVKKWNLRRKLLMFGAPLLLLVAITTGFFLFLGKPPLVPYRKGDKFGFTTITKKVIIGPRYDLAKPFSEKRAVVAIRTQNDKENFIGKYGYVDEIGREIVSLEYDYAEDFSQGLAKVRKFDVATNKQLYGFIDRSGAVVIPFKYDDALSFSPEGSAGVSIDGKWGFIDKTGAEIIQPKYDSVNNFSSDLAVVKLNSKYGFIDKSGKEKIPFSYDSAGDFSDDVAPVKQGDKAFFIDFIGKEAIPFKYSSAYSFSDHLAQVTLNGKTGFIDKHGGEAIPLIYEAASPTLSEGLVGVKLNNKYGFINKVNKEVIAFKYAEVAPFRREFAWVKNTEGKEFYIRFDGTEYYEP